MRNGIKAIDFMYYVATPEFIGRGNEAKKGELICPMEKAIGGLPQYDSFQLPDQFATLQKKTSISRVSTRVTVGLTASGDHCSSSIRR